MFCYSFLQSHKPTVFILGFLVSTHLFSGTASVLSQEIFFDAEVFINTYFKTCANACCVLIRLCCNRHTLLLNSLSLLEYAKWKIPRATIMHPENFLSHSLLVSCDFFSIYDLWSRLWDFTIIRQSSAYARGRVTKNISKNKGLKLGFYGNNDCNFRLILHLHLSQKYLVAFFSCF